MDAQGLKSSQRKLVMWYKVTELKSKGLHCVQIARELGLHRHTVEKYVKMTLEEFQTSQAYERGFKYKLDIFEEEVKNELMRAPYLSSRQVHDHLREHHADFPEVSEKTVFNFVMRVRDKYRIPKTNEETFRPNRCEVIKLAGTSYRLENRKTIFTSESTVNGKQLRKATSKTIETRV